MHNGKQASQALTDGNQQPVEQQAFDAWGKRRLVAWRASGRSTFQALTRHGFTGHEMLDWPSLVHMGGRVYDPQTGRFLSADPCI